MVKSKVVGLEDEQVNQKVAAVGVKVESVAIGRKSALGG